MDDRTANVWIARLDAGCEIDARTGIYTLSRNGRWVYIGTSPPDYCTDIEMLWPVVAQVNADTPTRALARAVAEIARRTCTSPATTKPEGRCE